MNYVNIYLGIRNRMDNLSELSLTGAQCWQYQFPNLNQVIPAVLLSPLIFH